jgi:uncharacterized membrane protein
MKSLVQQELPLGIIFSSFMVSYMIGSQFFSLFIQKTYLTNSRILLGVLTVSSIIFGCISVIPQVEKD